MSGSLGKVSLDLETNYSGFQSQLKGIAGNATGMVSKAFGKLGGIVAGAFAVKKLIDFGKASINLASDLAEVQNVVDVVFGESSQQINNFAKNALTAYGLSELSAKQYSSTMGAMLKSMGLTQDAVLNMSQSITALTGDMASFYNLDSDTAFQKIRAGISGETEPLKQLGINMSVANMEAYALSQGISKSYQKMSQSEQALLRYNYLLSTTADAQGDFARTSDSWANQTRILSEQFNSLKATLGSAFIAVLTPVVKMLNWIISKLQIAAAYFKAFVEALTGVKADSGGASSGLGAVADSAETAGAATEAAAKKAKKASQSLASFDKLNVLSSGGGDSDSDAGGGGGGGAGLSVPAFEFDASTVEDPLVDASGILDGFKTKLENLAAWTGMDKLWAHINDGAKKVDFTAIKTNFSSIFNSLKPIASSALNGVGTVVRAKSNFIGTTLGGLISTTGKSVEIATGGISQFLSSQGPAISAWVTETSNKLGTGFNNLSFTAETIFGSFWEALALNQTVIEESIANTLLAYSTMGMTIGTILTDLWLGLTQGFADFSVNEKATIDGFFSEVILSVTSVANTVSNIVGGIFSSVANWWDTSGKRVWGEIVGVFFDLVGWVTKLWNNTISPVIQSLSDTINKLWEENLKPLWDNILSFLTSVWDYVKTLYDGIKPIIDWIVDSVAPLIGKAVSFIGQLVGVVIGNIIDAISNIIAAAKGLLSFITGVFRGDWEQAWEGIKTFFKGIWDTMVSILKVPMNFIIGAINVLLEGIMAGANAAIKALNKLSFTVPDWVPGLGGKKWGFNIKELKLHKIPYLARGGIIDQPTLAMVGERGKEAVVPLENTAFADSIANAIMRVLMPLFNNSNGVGKNNSDSNTVIVLKVGEYELGRISVGAINKYHNVIGKVELEV